MQAPEQQLGEQQAVQEEQRPAPQLPAAATAMRASPSASGSGPAAAAAAPPPPPPVRRLVKLGGAAITVKSQLETLRPEVLKSAAHSLVAPAGPALQPPRLQPQPKPQPAATSSSAGGAGRSPQQQQGDESGPAAAAEEGAVADTVVVHGAGSFGHFQAAQYSVVKGPISDVDVRRGFALCRLSVTKLNGLVVAALLEAGAPACGLSPLGLYTTCGRQVHASGAAAVAALLRAGLLPVLHGDAVLDEVLGCTILSGDTLMRDLAQQLRPQHALFLTNVAGVYDRPPEEPGAVLLPRITAHADGTWQAEGAGGPIRMTSADYDTTGGIALKVEEAAVIARMGIPVLIAEAGSESGDLACRLGLEVLAEPGWRGTLVALAEP